MRSVRGRSKLSVLRFALTLALLPLLGEMSFCTSRSSPLILSFVPKFEIPAPKVSPSKGRGEQRADIHREPRGVGVPDVLVDVADRAADGEPFRQVLRIGEADREAARRERLPGSFRLLLRGTFHLRHGERGDTHADGAEILRPGASHRPS